jgi:hypothetical protein
MARLRDRGATLLVQGVWPLAEAALQIGESEWTGLGDGHGYLSSRAVTITMQSRRSPVPRRARMLLPDRDGALAPLTGPVETPLPLPLPMRAVG